MKRAKPFFRALAALLVFQPVFFHQSTVLAQNLERNESLALPSQAGADQQLSQQQLQLLQQQQQQDQQRDVDPLFSQPQQRDATQPGTLRPQQPSSGVLDADTLARSLPPIDEPVDPATYVCGPGDVLELNFWGLQSIRLRIVIDVEGRAFVPKVGYFNLGGKVLSEARRTLRGAIAGLYPRLSFDLALATPRTFQVQVVGAVLRPASYPSRATDRVATLIGRAGGLGSNASQRRIEIRHRDGTVDKADLLKFTQTGDIRFNPHVLDGDAIQVGFEDLAATIAGGVNRPGRYELTGTQDLAELIELAGGLTPDATRELPVSIVRWSEGVRQEQLSVPFAEAGRLPDAKLQKEDQVRIAVTAELQKSVYVIGAVAGATRAANETTTPDEASSTRRLPFVSGETVRGLLVRIGGVGPLADLRRSYLVREGRSVVPVDLERLIALRDLAADREILLGDTLVIPFKRTNILIEGSVFAPGSYPYNPTYGIDQYLALAGGPSRNAQEITNVRVVTPTGQLRPYQKDLVVEPGSSLVVPERNFSRAEIVSISLAIATLVISGVTVYLASKPKP